MTPLVLPVSAAVGLLAAVLVAVLHEAGGVVDDVCSRVPVPRGWAPVFGGLGIGLLAAVLPFLAGDGTGLLTVLAGGGHTVPVGTLMVLLTGEVLALAVALGAGGTGGVLGPLLLIGASLGAVLSAVADQTFPGVVDPSACPTSAVTLGMAAMLAGGSRAPLAAVVFMLEITHQASLAPALLLACAVSHLAALQFVPGGLLGTGREPAGIAALPLDQVRRAMIVPPQTVSWSMPLGPLAEACARPDGQPGYPVLDDDQRLVGVVTPADLPEPDARPELGWLVAHDVMRCRPLEVATPNESLRDAAERMVRGNAALLPVVDPARPDRVIGVLTRDAVLQALTDVSPVPPRQPPNRTPPVNGPGRRAA